MTDEDRLKAALRPFAEVADWADRNGHDLEADFDMILRGPGMRIAGHLHAQSADFVAAKALLDELDRNAPAPDERRG